MSKGRIYEAIQTVKAALPMQEVCSYYGLEFNRAGFARCPFHTEKTASFKIHNNRGHCFGCGWSGDVIQFVQSYCRTASAKDSLKQISLDFNLPLNIDEKPNLYQEHQLAMKRAAAKQEREKQREAEQRNADKLDALLSLYALLDRWMILYAPTTPDEPIDPRYAEACKYREYFKYESEQEEVRQFCLQTSNN